MRLFTLLIVSVAFFFVPMKESIHMYQQNRYQMKRYILWLKKNIRVKQKGILQLFCMFLPFYALCLIAQEHQPLGLLVLLMSIYAYVILKWDNHHDYIQKLSYTYRVKRLLLAEYVIYLVGITLLYSFFSIHTFILLLPFLFFSPWLSLILIGSIMFPLEQKIRYSYVKDAKKILSQQEHLIKVGITGSYGKTSVKNILHSLLAEKYYCFMTPHSYNNLMGLTISIRKLLKPLHEVFIAEIGADHVGEISELSNFIQPSIAVVTAVGAQHLETFGSQEHILQEKMQLVERLKQDGVAILNYDNDNIRNYRIKNPCSLITYGIHEEKVKVRAVEIKYSIKGSSFIVEYQQHRFPIETCLLGEHNVLNILGAISVALHLQVSIKEIQNAIQVLRYVPHRLEVCHRGPYTLLDDAYNSNPQGAKYAIDVLSQMPGTRFLLTPGFLDLGIETKKAHQEYGKQMVDHCDVIILIGEIQSKDIYQSLIESSFLFDHIYVVNSTRDAFSLLQTLVKEGDTALIENDLPDAFNY